MHVRNDNNNDDENCNATPASQSTFRNWAGRRRLPTLRQPLGNTSALYKKTHSRKTAMSYLPQQIGTFGKLIFRGRRPSWRWAQKMFCDSAWGSCSLAGYWEGGKSLHSNTTGSKQMQSTLQSTASKRNIILPPSMVMLIIHPYPNDSESWNSDIFEKYRSRSSLGLWKWVQNQIFCVLGESGSFIFYWFYKVLAHGGSPCRL